MAVNLIALNVYKINAQPFSGQVAFPANGITVEKAPANTAVGNVNIYGIVNTAEDPQTTYQVRETPAQVVAITNA